MKYMLDRLIAMNVYTTVKYNLCIMYQCWRLVDLNHRSF